VILRLNAATGFTLPKLSLQHLASIRLYSYSLILLDVGVNHRTGASEIKDRTFNLQVCAICNYAADDVFSVNLGENFQVDNQGKAFRSPYAFSLSKCGEQYS